MTKLRLDHDGVEQAVRIGKALDHPLRVRALAMLRDGELCVCELIEMLGLAASTVSKHMSVIADAGIVERRRDGRWTYYSLPNEPDSATEMALNLVMELVRDDPAVAEDRSRLAGVGCRTEAIHG